MDGQTDETEMRQSSKRGSQNTFVDYLIQYLKNLRVGKNWRETFAQAFWMDVWTDGRTEPL